MIIYFVIKKKQYILLGAYIYFYVSEYKEAERL